jgi:hypothetical protein
VVGTEELGWFGEGGGGGHEENYSGAGVCGR